MIDLEKEFPKYEKAIARYLSQRKQSYFDNRVYRKLRKRYRNLNDTNDMRFPSTSERFFSKMAFPLVKERTITRRAMLRATYRQDPIWTLDALGDTTPESAMLMGDVLNLNSKSTKFRQICFLPMTNSCARYGCSVTFTDLAETNQMIYDTVDGPMGPERQQVPIQRINARNVPIHILNYFRDPYDYGNNPSYEGHITRWRFSELMGRAKNAPELYIKENLMRCLKEGQKHLVSDANFHVEDKEDWNQHGIDISHFCAQINIEGNEDDETYYYVEMDGEHNIIRLQANTYDKNMRNYTISLVEPRYDAWWGNTDAEYVIPHENFYNLIMNATADQAMRNLESYVWYNKGMIDPADINNRHKNGGFIGADVKQGMTLSQMIYQQQPRNITDNNTQFALQELKESAQSLSTRPDLRRSANQGGLKNDTLGAAQMIEQQGNLMESDIMEQFGQGIIMIGEKNVTILKQFLPLEFAIRPKLNQSQMVIDKRQILGDMAVSIRNSSQTNKIAEAGRLQAAITQIMNFKGSQLPEIMQINLVPIIRKWIRELDLGDVEEIYPEQAQMAQAQAVPSLPPGQPQMQVANAA